MSKRNSPEAKRAARERMRAERERQAKREKLRRQLTVGGAAVAVLAVAAGIGVFVAGMGDGDDNTDWGAVRAQVDDGEGDLPTEPPANTSGEDGLTIRIGDENAANTLTLFEDARCPACAAFEQGTGATVREGMENGDYAVEYVFGTFLDGNLTGSGSKNALNALGAALNVSPEAFLDFHDALYSAEFHPAESTDEFGDDERLIEIAQTVPELEGNQEFEDAVTNDTFAVWALQMSDKFDADPDVEGTPTLKFNGEVVETPQTPEDLTAMVEANSVAAEDEAAGDAGSEEDTAEGDGESGDSGATE
ncbi:thioredoxin domain-containing protein [Streptomyces litchfieldiae]|uniref:Thioredoxin domain-containing protein n=1 Tax=Streptomyces litchfieldiae TaxID=3075543 RepID=A0ABU2MY04_9ACTN|nr:thioredoxin domain-containing protein [Streptomyces sp. DSM 44938]MDT0346504.1 thioredoxin domain-containing protein [Streptomyces sp. DSM 44938]